MLRNRRLTLLHTLLAGALPLLFLFTAVVPASAATSGGITVTKTCFPQQVRPGQFVNCTIIITNTTTVGKTVVLTDIIAGGNLYPDTYLIFGPFFGPTVNQVNRQEWRTGTIFLPALSPSVYNVGIIPFQTRSACINSFYANLSNEVHVDLFDFNTQQTTGPHVATARASFSVSCNAR
jgi:hypothetical protein